MDELDENLNNKAMRQMHPDTMVNYHMSKLETDYKDVIEGMTEQTSAY